MNAWFSSVVFSTLLAGASAAFANPAKPLKFWNLTASPITDLQLAPAGTAQFSTLLCLSDPDHAVDPDERLSLVGVEGGTYDVRVVDSGKRTCLFHAVTLKSQGPYAFSISEQEMKTCTDH